MYCNKDIIKKIETNNWKIYRICNIKIMGFYTDILLEPVIAGIGAIAVAYPAYAPVCFVAGITLITVYASKTLDEINKDY